MGREARANAARRRGLIRLVNTEQAQFAEHIRLNAMLCRDVVQPGIAEGESLVIAGAGPSLAEHGEECDRADEAWACNSALDWLLEHGHRVTHGFSVNQLDAELWASSPDVDYLLASTVQPELARRLHDADRRITWFHNTVDLREQDTLYAELYPTTVCAGSGLNTVTRAIDVASCMGFERITVVGADCSFRGDAVHVNGDSPDWQHVTMGGEIDGQHFTMTPDMAISANVLVRQVRASRGRIRLVGSGFSAAILGKDDAFLDKLPHMVFENGERVPMAV